LKLRAWSVGWSFALVVWTTAAAGSPRVALVVGEEATSESSVTTQLRAELSAAGFEIVVTQSSNPETSRESLEKIARDTDSFAAIAVVEPEDGLAVDIWVADRVTGKTVLRRIDAGEDQRQGAAIVALRAVELLRASLLELNLPDRPRGEVGVTPEVRAFVPEPPPRLGPAPPPAPIDRVEPGVEPKRQRFGVALGGAAFVAPGGIPLAPAPRLVISWRPLEDWAGALDLSGPALASVEGRAGRASVDQELALGKIQLEPTWGDVSPLAAIGVGAFRLGARGSARAPFEDRSGGALAFALAIGAGARIRVAEHVRLVLDAQAVGLFPKPVVRFAGEQVAATGRPLLLAGVGAEIGW
jgi:hypothetical protein